jgi:hypothetical protein
VQVSPGRLAGGDLGASAQVLYENDGQGITDDPDSIRKSHRLWLFRRSTHGFRVGTLLAFNPL